MIYECCPKCGSRDIFEDWNDEDHPTLRCRICGYMW